MTRIDVVYFLDELFVDRQEFEDKATGKAKPMFGLRLKVKAQDHGGHRPPHEWPTIWMTPSLAADFARAMQSALLTKFPEEAATAETAAPSGTTRPLQ